MEVDDFVDEEGAHASGAESDTMDVGEEAAVLPVQVLNQELDVEAYISAYSGRTRVLRLLYIAAHSPNLAVDALTIAVQDLSQSTDYRQLELVICQLNEACQSAGVAPSAQVPTEKFIADLHTRVVGEREKLEGELRTSRSAGVKDTVRMAHEDLGDYYYAAGDVTNALKNYTRMRENAANPLQLLTTCLKLVKVYAESAQWNIVSGLLSKAEATPNYEKHPDIVARVRLYSGLCAVVNRDFAKAARVFLDCNVDIVTKHNDILSVHDIALLGSVCGLLSLSRDQINTKILHSPTFKAFLEFSHDARELSRCLYSSKYSQLPPLLQNIKAELVLDVYSHKEAEIIIKKLKTKALLQFIRSYCTIDLVQMSQTFCTTPEALTEEIVSLITDHVIQGRIDNEKKVLVISQSDRRTAAFHDTLEVGQVFESHARALFVRTAMLKRGFLVRAKETTSSLTLLS